MNNFDDIFNKFYEGWSLSYYKSKKIKASTPVSFIAELYYSDDCKTSFLSHQIDEVKSELKALYELRTTKLWKELEC